MPVGSTPGSRSSSTLATPSNISSSPGVGSSGRSFPSLRLSRRSMPSTTARLQATTISSRRSSPRLPYPSSSPRPFTFVRTSPSPPQDRLPARRSTALSSSTSTPVSRLCSGESACSAGSPSSPCPSYERRHHHSALAGQRERSLPPQHYRSYPSPD